MNGRDGAGCDAATAWVARFTGGVLPQPNNVASAAVAQVQIDRFIFMRQSYVHVDRNYN
jgi:hypothetical protein